MKRSKLLTFSSLVANQIEYSMNLEQKTDLKLNIRFSLQINVLEKKFRG